MRRPSPAQAWRYHAFYAFLFMVNLFNTLRGFKLHRYPAAILCLCLTVLFAGMSAIALGVALRKPPDQDG
jgi:hypothetical protein